MTHRFMIGICNVQVPHDAGENGFNGQMLVDIFGNACVLMKQQQQKRPFQIIHFIFNTELNYQFFILRF